MKVSLINAKFGADLITISKDTDHKTKWPRFFGLPGIAIGFDVNWYVLGIFIVFVSLLSTD